MLAIDPVWQADTQQAHFRLLLDAMAYPGRCLILKTLPIDGGQVALSVLSTLLDAEVSLADPHKLLKDDDWKMLQTNSVAVDEADYILCTGSQFTRFTPKLGRLKSPEQSATLILVVDKLGVGDLKLNLSGPGIQYNKLLSVTGLAAQWLARREECNIAFPLGIDLILIDDTQIAALPRTTKVEIL